MTDEKRAAMHAAIDRSIDAVLAECPDADVSYLTCLIGPGGATAYVQFYTPDRMHCSYHPDRDDPWVVSERTTNRSASGSLADALAGSAVTP